MKKVLMLLENPFIRDNRVDREIYSLISNNHLVLLVCWDRELKYPAYEELYNGQLKIFRVKYYANRGNGFFYLFFKYLKLNVLMIKKGLSLNFDIIHSHNLETILAGRILKTFRKKPLIYDAHEVLGVVDKRLFKGSGKILHSCERILAKNADSVIVVTPGMIDLFRLRGYKNKLVSIENFPQKEDFKLRNKRETKINSHITLGYIGVINKGKNIDLIIESIKSLKLSGCNIDLLIAGPIGSGNEKYFMELFERNKDLATYCGVIPAKEIPELYKKIDISINVPEKVPGYKYGYPSKLFEAMASGVPTIQTNMGESFSIIENEKCGMIIDDPNKLTIMESINAFIENKEKIKEYGQNGFIAFEKKYNWNNVSYKLIKTYSGLLTN